MRSEPNALPQNLNDSARQQTICWSIFRLAPIAFLRTALIQQSKMAGDPCYIVNPQEKRLIYLKFTELLYVI